MRTVRLIAVCLGVLALFRPVDSLARVGAGIQGAWGSRMNYGVGLRVYIQPDKSVPQLEYLASFDYFFPGDDFGIDLDYWEFTSTLSYSLIFVSRSPTPYLGAGLTWSEFEASLHALGTDIAGREEHLHLNLTGGVVFPLGRVRPFLEGRLTTGESGQFVLSTGVRFW